MPGPSKARTEKAHAIDRLVGQQLRKRRIELGLTQLSVAEAIGVTFQQIQKYERGSNRIVASRLYDLAKTLDGLASCEAWPANCQVRKKMRSISSA